MAQQRTSADRGNPPLAETEPAAAAGSDSLRAEVERLRRELARAQKLAALGTLAGGICHEVNNILTPVMSYAEMAMEAPGDAPLTRKALERAYHGADRASRVASAILAFAADKPRRTKSATTDVASTVAEAWMCVATDPARLGIRVVTEIEPGCAAAIDQVEFQQVVLNLVLNAMKAMRPSGGRLTIRANNRRARAGDGSTWNARPNSSSTVIEVEDTGCGIEPERLNRIFEPFVGHRWENAGSEADSGTGLGLTVCKHLVESAGGSIVVRSQVSVGTCFTITLPAAKPVPARSEPAAARR